MKLTCFLSALLLICSMSMINAQKVKYKKNIVTVDKKQYAKIYKDFFNATLYSLRSDKELVYIKLMQANSHDSYYLIRFLDHGKEAEIDAVTIKSIIKHIYRSKVFVNDEIDIENMNRFVNKHGTDESSRRYFASYRDECNED